MASSPEREAREPLEIPRYHFSGCLGPHLRQIEATLNLWYLRL